MSSNNNFSSSVSKKRGSTSANGGGKCSGKNPRSNPTVTMPTIAASWGAYSPSSSSASKSSSKINRKAPFSDFGSYMTEKNRKLRDQFDADASGSGEGSDLFGGVSIFVNGFTVPSSQELRGFMLKHGGRVENYFSRKRVTHIICSNLPDSKLKNFRSFSKGLPVVKPIWIVDSIEAGKLLSWVPYQFEDFAESCKQQKLSSFFCAKNISRCTIAEAPAAPAESSESNISFLKYKEDHIEADCRISEFKGGTGEEALISRPDITKDQNNSLRRLKFSSCRHSKGAPSSSQQWSTVDDSNFVENYFKNSRLHFIGTWRNRYRKRFFDKSKGLRLKESDTQTLSAGTRTIIHIDMDCFFVSVIVRNHPELLNQPVAICHSDNPKGTAEISSANYPARDYGVRAGMFVKDAKTLCPQLIIFPYNFEAYEEVADQFYDILHKHCDRVQAVSCDEAFLDITGTTDDPEVVASKLRKEIMQTTRCPASAGISENLLIARLATRSAKPNGQLSISSEKIQDYMKNLPVNALSGIGWALQEKLKARGILTCGQLRSFSKEILQKDFGLKIGDMLWNYSRGIDNRKVEVVQETKSIGAEINWGVRFNTISDCDCFFLNLCKEVSLRLRECGVRGHTIILKVKKRKAGAAEPMKYMGCGDCINMSRTKTVPIATDDEKMILKICKQLFGSFHLDVKDVRGIGLQITKLEHFDIKMHGYAGNSLESWLASASESISSARKAACIVKEDSNREKMIPYEGLHMACIDSANQQLHGTIGGISLREEVSSRPLFSGPLTDGSCSGSPLKLPPIAQLDVDIIKNLPSEIFIEMNEMYNGNLSCILESYVEEKHVDRHVETTTCKEASELSSSGGKPEISKAISCTEIGESSFQYSFSKDKGRNVVSLLPSPSHSISSQNKVNEDEMCAVRGDYSHSGQFDDFVLSSLSQVDISLLEQLPVELKTNILEVLPAHRNSENFIVAIEGQAKQDICGIGMKGSWYNNINLWDGDPPTWVHEFQVTNCAILNIFAESYLRCAKTRCLSSILLDMLSKFHTSLHSIEEGLDEAFSGTCELLIQYINIKLKEDVEEIYVCFRLLRRFASGSRFFLHVLDEVLPLLQASVSESYGGKLSISVVN